MRVRLFSVLRHQRRLLSMPRGGDRFREYVNMMRGGSDDIEIPLSLFNPMAKEHAAHWIDRAEAWGLEYHAGRAATAAGAELPDTVQEFLLYLVLIDDLEGGWTNRYSTEHSVRFGHAAMIKRSMIVVPLWTSEEPDPADVVVKTKQAVFRTWWELRHGPATTVGAMMVQAGAAARFAGRTPVLPVAALAAANDGLAPHRDATDYPTVIAALYGDEAAATLGLPPLGLPPRAGLEVGLAEAYAG